MGGGSWDAKSWSSYSTTASTKSRAAIYTSSSIKENLDPKDVGIRESRDSVDHPASTAIIVALDVTGSMGMIAENIAKKGLGTLFNEILDRKPVTDPQLMFMAVGDAMCDDAPLQVSQFESDNRIVEQLTDIYLEGGGGGNNTESYDFPWYFAAKHTSIDCFEKRGRKGYLFTVGDECSPAGLTKSQLKKFVGDSVQEDYSAEELLAMVEKKYNVYHIIILEGSYCKGDSSKAVNSWNALMGQRAIKLKDYTKLSETIISIIQMNEGATKEEVVKSWDGSTSLVIKEALSDSLTAVKSNSGVVKL